MRGAIYRASGRTQTPSTSACRSYRITWFEMKCWPLWTKSTPPVLETLLARLDAEDADVRLAAAVVLGHANGPVISESLIGRVSQEPGVSHRDLDRTHDVAVAHRSISSWRLPRANPAYLVRSTVPVCIGRGS